MSKLIIYHDQCVDGFASAWVAHHVYGEDIEFHPASYGDPPPDVKGREVLVLDFSYPRKALLEMRRDANTLLVIDHHKTAKEQLDDLDFVIFNMNKSGCVLTWNRLMGTRPPDVLLYVQDRDLWKWELPFSKEINAAIGSFGFDFGVWDMMVLRTEVTTLRADGTAIQRMIDRKAVDRAKHAFIVPDFFGTRYTVPVVNATEFQSEIGHLLCRMHPDAPFSAICRMTVTETIWSLRSIGDFDVSAVASSLGGGGHRNAAGFRSESGIQGAERTVR